MKSKIVALVLVLLLIPSILMAASKYTKTEKVTYNACFVKLENSTFTDTVLINGKTYVSAKSLSSLPNRIMRSDKTGNVVVDRPFRLFTKHINDWEYTLNEVQEMEGREFDSVDANGNYYFENSKLLGLDCMTVYSLGSGKLSMINSFFETSEINISKDFDYVCDELYDEFRHINYKEKDISSSCPETLSDGEALLKGYATWSASFSDKINMANVIAYTNDEGKVMFGITLLPTPK